VWERLRDLSALRAVLVAAPAFAPRVRRVVASFSGCSPRVRLVVVLVSVLGLQSLANLKMIEIYAYGRLLSSKPDLRVRLMSGAQDEGERPPGPGLQALFREGPDASCRQVPAVGNRPLRSATRIIGGKTPDSEAGVSRPGRSGCRSSGCRRGIIHIGEHTVKESGEPSLDVGSAQRDQTLDAVSASAGDTRVAQHLEVVGQGGPGDRDHDGPAWQLSCIAAQHPDDLQADRI
jgi:hypothetical protein